MLTEENNSTRELLKQSQSALAELGKYRGVLLKLGKYRGVRCQFWSFSYIKFANRQYCPITINYIKYLTPGTDLLNCTEFLLHTDKRTRALLQDPKVSLKAKVEILTSSLDKQCDEIIHLEKDKTDGHKQVWFKWIFLIHPFLYFYLVLLSGFVISAPACIISSTSNEMSEYDVNL